MPPFCLRKGSLVARQTPLDWNAMGCQLERTRWVCSEKSDHALYESSVLVGFVPFRGGGGGFGRPLLMFNVTGCMVLSPHNAHLRATSSVCL